MLELLHIENIAIIERADILFGRGFNALRRRRSSARRSAQFRQICRGSPKTALRRRRTERFYCSASCTVTAKTSAAWADGR